MNATTINSFPPFHAMNQPRGWILALIVLMHIGFFVALSSGMSVPIFGTTENKTDVVVIPEPVDPDPPEPIDYRKPDFDRSITEVFVPEPVIPFPEDEPKESAPRIVTSDPPPPVVRRDEAGSAAPVITMPEIDPRAGLSEPLYPASEIRANHTGTVVLSLYVLENGRVGDVRLDQSSGYEKLDQSALREARKWRLKPGMRDGVPVAMWKQIPITFRLQEGGSRF